MLSSKSIIFKLAIVVSIFAFCTAWMFYLSMEATRMLQSEAILSSNQTLSFPTNFEELKSLSSLLKASYSRNANFILILYCSTFLYKQTFAIPGSVFLNLLAGSLFGLYKGILLAATLTTLGALGCFFLSKICGEAVVKRFFNKKLIEIRQLTDQQSTLSLFSYLLSIRLFPASPNWLINILCPIVGVSWWLFAFSVYIGLLPYIYLCVQTGQILSDFTSTSEIFTTTVLMKSSLVALVAVSPNLLAKYFKSIKPSSDSDHLKMSESVRRSSRNRTTPARFLKTE